MTSTPLFIDRSHPSASYQQALCDFGIAELIEALSNFCDPDFDVGRMHLEEQELEHLATLLIQQLCVSLNGKMMAGYLNVVRNADAWTITDLPRLELKPLQHLLVLPKSFPHQTSAPRFLDGDSVCWLSLPNCSQTDRGIVIGRFFAFASHHGQWEWKYLIWLKDTSSGVLADTAWEEDLESLEEEKYP
ncbi:hypothetical protein [Thermocoleostomius sinensis]|uniref:DUF1822 family protein n=1 Tax=Thermocoleostomius sinensis A174 TaxID=2016057 RepID=A0A9E8ZE01_9CYAN|nr:hypothetical protein [Thermocoleostomius sinensis]WAL61222.1 hypothetical protein OXH18_04265 [Thermocoleostomius sinensis A174]